MLGLMVDAGAPDGAFLSAVLRPLHWLRIHAGAGHNLIGLGLRGGLSLIPFRGFISPTLDLEGGHSFKGDLRSPYPSGEGIPETLGYSYGNAHLGIELGSDNFRFFLRGGYSYVAAEADLGELDESGVRFDSPAELSLFTPSAKLGFIFYLF